MPPARQSAAAIMIKMNMVFILPPVFLSFFEQAAPASSRAANLPNVASPVSQEDCRSCFLYSLNNHIHHNIRHNTRRTLHPRPYHTPYPHSHSPPNFHMEYTDLPLLLQYNPQSPPG